MTLAVGLAGDKVQSLAAMVVGNGMTVTITVDASADCVVLVVEKEIRVCVVMMLLRSRQVVRSNGGRN